MTTDARFGIEFSEHPTPGLPLDGMSTTRVGHVWSEDAQHLVERGDGAIFVVDPSGANPLFVNSSLAATHAFLEAFRLFYLVERPTPYAAKPTMTVAEARAKLARLHRGEPEPVVAAEEPIPRGERLAALRADLETRDAPALEPATWWSRVLDELATARV
ncbi:SUKH-4 family immunity protein [Frondihabitans cladoniiphilus]